MNIGGAVVGVALYLGGAAGILWLVLRSSRNLLDRKQAALTAGLQSAGASSRGTTEGGLYQGTDVSFELGGREVISNVRFVSESWVRANLRVKTGPLPWAIFSAERAVDRFGKLLGVNREVQTGDAEFDRQCYVDSPESDEVVKRLLAPPAVRSGISALLKLGFRVQTSTRGLEAYQVVSAYAKLRDFSSGEGAQRLLELADVMPPFDGVSPRPPGRDRNLALGGVAAAMTLGGFLGTAALGERLGNTVDQGAETGVVLGAGAVLWALWLVSFSVAVRGHSNAMRLLVVSTVVSLSACRASAACSPSGRTRCSTEERWCPARSQCGRSTSIAASNRSTSTTGFNRRGCRCAWTRRGRSTSA